MTEGPPKDSYEVDHVSPVELVRMAYGLHEDYEVLGLPEWAKSARYDMVAKIRGEDVAAFKKLGLAQTNRMLQPVLEDRFGLRVHWEKRILPTRTLTLAKKSSALKEATSADDKMITVGQMSFGPGTIAVLADGTLISRAATMGDLANQLEGELREVVVDATGLKGNYDYQIQLPRGSTGASAVASGSPSPMQPDDSIEGSLYQVGLKLVPSKTELPVLVVDAIQQPSPN